jgi:ribosomal protein S25
VREIALEDLAGTFNIDHDKARIIIGDLEREGFLVLVNGAVRMR